MADETHLLPGAPMFSFHDYVPSFSGYYYLYTLDPLKINQVDKYTQIPFGAMDFFDQTYGLHVHFSTQKTCKKSPSNLSYI